jgi:hypothetical protein
MRHTGTFNIEDTVKKDSLSSSFYDKNVFYSEIFKRIAMKLGLPAAEDVVGPLTLTPNP